MTTTKSMTEAQFTFALTLACEVYADPSVRAEELLKLAGLDFYSISTRIDELKALKAGAPKSAAAPQATYQPLGYQPPKGYYMIDRKSFYIKPGKYSGMVVIGADKGNKGCYLGTLNQTKNAWLAAALDNADKAYAATVAYGKAHGKCGVCGKALTNPVSVAKKIGPVCAKKYGY